MYRRKPVTEIVEKIRELIKKNSYGALSLSNKIKSTGIRPDMNPGRIERAFYQSVNRLSYVKSLDDTIDAVLTLFGLTNEDLYKMLLEGNVEEFDKEEKEFMKLIKDPEARPFLRLAMAQYQLRKIEKEIGKLN